MISPIDKVLDEGNCGAGLVSARVTDRGEEACECVEKLTLFFVVSRILIKAARLRTETSYKAGSVRRVGQSPRSRTQTTARVNDELVQRNNTMLSLVTVPYPGRPARLLASSRLLQRVGLAPKSWNPLMQISAGKAGVSRGHSTEPRTPFETGRTER